MLLVLEITNMTRKEWEIRLIRRHNLQVANSAEKDAEEQRKKLGVKPLKIGQIYQIEFKR